MKRVLLVPDQGIIGELGSSYFDRHSMSVRTAHDAAEALTMASALRPDLVVLRDDLKGTSTRAFCDAMRKLLPGVRLLLVTELLGVRDDTTGLCDACLVQPVPALQLLETAATLLELRVRRSPRASLEALVHMEGFGVETPDGTCVANAIDVSEYGILLESSEHLSLGTSGTLLFFLPTESGRVAAGGTARVAMDEVRLHYAIEFADIDDASRVSIVRYIDQQGKA